MSNKEEFIFPQKKIFLIKFSNPTFLILYKILLPEKNYNIKPVRELLHLCLKISITSKSWGAAKEVSRVSPTVCFRDLGNLNLPMMVQF
jgi:hypothetical protein